MVDFLNLKPGVGYNDGVSGWDMLYRVNLSGRNKGSASDICQYTLCGQ